MASKIVIPDFIKKPVLLLWNLHQLWWILIATAFAIMAGHTEDMGALARVGIKSIIYFIIITIIAIFIGLIWGNIFHPGDGIDLSKAKAPDAGTTLSLEKLIRNTIPESIFIAGFNNNSLQVTFAALMFGISVALVKEKAAKKTVVGFFDGALKAMFVYINLIMRFVPFAIFGALASAVADNGGNTLVALGKLIGTVYIGLATFLLVVLLPIALVTRLPFREFGRALWEPLVIAFSTASSDAALARAIENMVAFGVPKDIVGLVIPLGYSFNLDGTTMYLATAMLFSAQAAKVSLDLKTQISNMFVLYLSSKGIAGVPRASLVILAGALPGFGIPAEAVTVILGVDEIMDMARTAVNLTGNMFACYVMAKWEGRFREPGWDDDASTLAGDADDLEDEKKHLENVETPEVVVDPKATSV
ncbi:hypothetical protein HDU93_005259 [Gonapodya sp. JEL0774]|nr:hypothetical protein HDU93_005259 [Gonapodya sp. JEL0774]